MPPSPTKEAPSTDGRTGPAAADGAHDPRGSTFERRAERDRMVREQIVARGVTDTKVLEAMANVPRHRFVPEKLQAEAYADHPVPIGHGATISQPYIVALMTELADVEPGEKVLEVGTGSGYQAAVLAAIGGKVFSVERVAALAEAARKRLRDLGYDDVEVRFGDGYAGWPEEAPFDAIVVTAAPPEVPEALISQLAEGGRLVVPVGGAYQELKVLTREGGGIRKHAVIPVRFVPMVEGIEGNAEAPR